MKKHLWLLSLGFVLLSTPVLADAQDDVMLERMTWQEIRHLIDRGYRTVLIPTGGTEQNGPHLTVSKHNDLMAFTAVEIAKTLGDALVAPVVVYVPEGTISPPEGHMKFAGTVSLQETTFKALITDIASSLREHGFQKIVLLGDHGGSAKPLKEVADALNKSWRGRRARVVHIADYYADNGQKKWMKEKHPGIAEPSAHAGFMDTSEMMVANPKGIRKKQLKTYGADDFMTLGVAGDPMEASKESGIELLKMKINAAVKQIQHDG